MSDDLEFILKDVHSLAKIAVACDQNKDYIAAIYYYQEVILSLKKLADDNEQITDEDVESKISEYESRIKALAEITERMKGTDEKIAQNESDSSIKRLEFLLGQALDEDEEGNIESALQLYMEAIETGLEIKDKFDSDFKEQLTFIIKNALERAEKLKATTVARANKDKQLEDKTVNVENFTRSPTHIITGRDSYTKEEILVLKTSSNVNQIDYLPFMEQIDLREKFFTITQFCDKNGLLTLSRKQKENFRDFRRLSEIAECPVIFANANSIDCFSIKQTIVSDCSFIASLTVASLYERRFGKKLISNIIFPQNRNGDAVYNPCGKYMIKLNINGIWRKIIIDDRLPVGSYGQLLCSYSSNKNEFWISLMEKAYMKVMGGYDFPGSNSNIDLHALTGWIPERVNLKDWDKRKLFELILTRYAKGDLLVTFATGEFSDAQSERTGLVSTHAYAMLDIKLVQNKMLFLLKNPWAHVRWKGKFSERDVQSWTPELQKILDFDPKSARNFDNGIFWIDIDSLFGFYELCYLSWNPSLFKYSYCTHDKWNAGVGPARDLYYIGDNPQYSLTVSNPNSSVWIVLTRHIMDRNDFANNKEYIALLVYKNNGEKVYIPSDPMPYIDGARINSPHYLCKVIVSKENPETRYTLVVSQYEKSTTILYTLRAYSTSPFKMEKIVNIYRHKEMDKKGQWSGENAGGCANNASTYHLNPAYNLELNGSSRDEDNEIMIELRGPKSYSIGLDISPLSVLNSNTPNYFRRKSTPTFRSGYTYLKVKAIPTGTYQIVPSTFYPNQVGPFFLTVHSTHSIRLFRAKNF